jgi:hypothetical protein
MITNIRLTKAEIQLLEKKAREVNKVLINNDHPPVQESELLHKVIQACLCAVKAEASGEIIIDR